MFKNAHSLQFQDISLVQTPEEQCQIFRKIKKLLKYISCREGLELGQRPELKQLTYLWELNLYICMKDFLHFGTSCSMRT